MKVTTRIKFLLFLGCIVFGLQKSFSQIGNLKARKDVGRKSPAQQRNFIKFFPDTALAMLVAERLHKDITDNVTVEELAGIKGYFNAGITDFGEVSSLKGIGYLSGIDSFACNKTNVKYIPSEIGKLKNLVWLNLVKDFDLETIPAEIGKLEKLKYFVVVLSELKAVPPEIGNLTNLEVFSVCCNDLSSIPPEIGNLKNLTDLDIHSNNFKTLPDEICNLTSLNSLYLDDCGLEKLPDNIGNLTQLKVLNLFGDDLRYLPKSLVNLDNLSDLNVYDNFNLSEGYKKYLPRLLRAKMKK